MKHIQHDFKVGDPVSYCFNGDCYPDGYVEKITKHFLTTSNGHKYHLSVTEMTMLDKTTGDWVPQEVEYFASIHGGTWALVHGHIEERNPHF